MKKEFRSSGVAGVQEDINWAPPLLITFIDYVISNDMAVL
jgi:hypothetical protein